jgi:hypothetical protein
VIATGIEQVKLIHRTEGGSLVRSEAVLEYKDGRIWFLKSPFALKDEIKAMSGSQWHGYQDPPRKIWSVKDCQRNRFQLSYLAGEDVYAWFDREVKKHEYERPLREHQKDLADHFLTYHYGIMAAAMGVGKTLAAQEIMEHSGVKNCLWVGPLKSLPNIKREFRLWNLDPSITVKMLNYEALGSYMQEDGFEVPQLVVFDESSRCKGESTQRSRAAQDLADKVREKYGFEGYVIEMSGTPSPKTPCDWWRQCEIAWPGFLKEGSKKALEMRLAFTEKAEYDAGVFSRLTGWRDDEKKCKHCGKYEGEVEHNIENGDFHPFEPSFNEVAYLYERLKGLVIIKTQDCLDLPDLQYRTVYCKPNASTLRVAQALSQAAPNTITGMTLLRELSDGFQYREIKDGTTSCGHCGGSKTVEEWFDPDDEQRVYRAVDMFSPETIAHLQKRTIDCPQCGGSGEVPRMVRTVKEVPCPKDKALRDLLDECTETGRIVIFAGFTGSIDRIVKLCHNEGWAVVRCDGRGWQVTRDDGSAVLDEEALDFWANMKNENVAFVSHPESGGMSLTLVESRMEVFYSNSFKPEYRTQAKERIHRLGMDMNKGAVCVDLIHLPTDERVLQVVNENRRLELMTMGELTAGIDWSVTD